MYRGWPLVVIVVGALAVTGWGYLIAMVADMVPAMDMSEAGPGMGLFNQFNIFRGLPAEARAALSALCLPAGSTFGMPGSAMTALDLGKIFVMWAMMALAMMLPTAIPMLRAYNAAHPGAGPGGLRQTTDAVLVMTGYLLVWLTYAVMATLVQWALSHLGALTDMMAPVSLALTTSVLLAAGLYQFTPAKRTCLERCWYPRWFSGGGHARVTTWTAVREGVAQGWTCLGCCWAVMTVMFAVGLMNVLWIAILGAIMALEKTFPSRFSPIVIGVFFLSWGGLLAVGLVFNRF